MHARRSLVLTLLLASCAACTHGPAYPPVSALDVVPPNASGVAPPLRMHRLAAGQIASTEICRLRGTGGIECWDDPLKAPTLALPDRRFDHIGLGCAEDADGVVCGSEEKWVPPIEGPAITAVRSGSLNTELFVVEATGEIVHLKEYARAKAVPRVRGARRAVGIVTSCAIVAQGKVWCWGQNHFGEAGSPVDPECAEWRDADDGSDEHWEAEPASCDSEPAQVAGLHSVTDLVVGSGLTCALAHDGRVRCWGETTKLGFEGLSRAAKHTPTVVPGLHDVVEIAAAVTETCALTRAGEIHCWGALLGKRLATPTRIEGLPAATAISLGGDQLCLIDAHDQVLCRGYAGAFSFDPGARLSTYPMPRREELGLGRPIQHAGVGASGCVLREDGRVLCWGDNQHGQATGSPSDAPTQPTLVPNVERARFIGATRDVSCALVDGGDLVCWGAGRLPGGPAVRTVLSGVHSFSARDGQVCAIAGANRRLHCASAARGGGLRYRVEARDIADPVRVAGRVLERLQDVAVGTAHLCAIDERGAAHCTGDNSRGQLGSGDGRPVPNGRRLDGLPRLREIAAWGTRTCATARDGRVYCWGGSEHFAPTEIVQLCGATHSLEGDVDSWVVRRDAGVGMRDLSADYPQDFDHRPWAERPELHVGAVGAETVEIDGFERSPFASRPGLLCVDYNDPICWVDESWSTAFDATNEATACAAEREAAAPAAPHYPLVPQDELRIYAMVAAGEEGDCSDRRVSWVRGQPCDDQHARGARLTEAERQRVIERLNSDDAYDPSTSLCFIPRHQLVFFDRGKPVAAIDFCFECHTHAAAPPLPRHGSFRWYDYLARLCRAHGLPGCPK